MPFGSSGQGMPTLYTRTPISRAVASSMPMSVSACMTSSHALPVLTMPSRAGWPSGTPKTFLSNLLTRAQASAAGILKRVKRSSSLMNGSSGQRRFSPPSGISTPWGVTMVNRPGDTSTIPAVSMVSVTALIATHNPL